MIKKKVFIKIILSNLTTDPWEVHVVQYGHTRPWPVEIAQGVPGFWSNKNDQMGLKIKIPGARITQIESEVKPLWFLGNLDISIGIFMMRKYTANKVPRTLDYLSAVDHSNICLV